MALVYVLLLAVLIWLALLWRSVKVTRWPTPDEADRLRREQEGKIP